MLDPLVDLLVQVLNAQLTGAKPLQVQCNLLQFQMNKPVPLAPSTKAPLAFRQLIPLYRYQLGSILCDRSGVGREPKSRGDSSHDCDADNSFDRSGKRWQQTLTTVEQDGFN
jgi:hypothetical protein